MSDCCAPRPVAGDRDAVSATVMPSFALRPGVALPDWSVATSPRAKEALLALVQSDHVLHRWSGYTCDADRVRGALLHLYAEAGRAPSVGVLAARTGLSESAVRSSLDDLSRHDLVVLDGERIVGAYPFTDAGSEHRVTLDRRSVNAMCAVDALGIGAMLDSDIAIGSLCRHCGAPIWITTRDEGRSLAIVEPKAAMAWLSSQYEGGCAAKSICTETAFFCTDDHLVAWRRNRHSDLTGFGLSIEEAFEVGRAVFGPSLIGIDAARHEGEDFAREERGPRLQTGPASQASPKGDRGSKVNGRNTRSYDLAIIGAGSAGFSAAITAAEQGANVALVGHGTIGGTCVNVGCVPSKRLIRAMESLHHAQAATRFAGIRAEGCVIDWAALTLQKDDLVADLRREKYADVLPAYSTIAYLDGPARLTDGGVAADGTLVKTSKVIITTGARPAVPPIPGLETIDYLTSTSALDLKTLPKSLLVVGGGFVGAELAQIFARAGVRVTIVCRSRLLPAAESEIGEALSRYFRDEGITLVCGAAYEFCRKTNQGIALCVRQDGRQQVLAAEQILVATGRSPNVEQLGLAEAGVRQAKSGAIDVDDRMRTTRSGTYAAGDVTGRDQFVYMAAYGAKLAVRNALNGDRLVYDNSAMPEVVFTDPQLATVGLTEAQARAVGHQVTTSVLSLSNVPRALAARDTRGLIKLVADAKSRKLLGAHILAPEGGDSIQTAAMAIKAAMTIEQLADTIFPYLTTVEGLKLAALAFSKDVTKLSCCAG